MDRDAESYRKLMDTQLEKSNVVSPYDHFFMKEAAKRGSPELIA